MFSVLFLFFFFSFLLLALLPGYLFFRGVGFDWLQGGQQRFDWRRGGRQRIVCALLTRYVLCRVSFSILFCSLFLFSDYLCFLRRLTTCGLVRGQTGPTRAAIETWNKTVVQQVRVMLFYLFSTLFISSSRSSSFPLSTVKQQVGPGGMQRDRRGRRSNTGRDRGAGEREEEVERLGWRSKGGGGRRRGEGRARD